MGMWQRTFFRAAGFGAGFAGFLSIAIAGWLFYQSLPDTPKPWNRDVIKATFVNLRMNPGERPVATFKYTLENTTPHDYYLPSDGKSAFILLPDGKGMSQDEELVWEKGVYLPSGQKVTVSFRVIYDYNDSYPKVDRDNIDKLSKFMSRRLKDLDGFTVLDRENRYQITFPKGWTDSPSEPKDK
jgi:hypothetical protein